MLSLKRQRLPVLLQQFFAQASLSAMTARLHGATLSVVRRTRASNKRGMTRYVRRQTQAGSPAGGGADGGPARVLGVDGRLGLLIG